MKFIKPYKITKKYGLIGRYDTLFGLYRLYGNIYYYNDENLSVILNKKELKRLKLKSYEEEHIYYCVNLRNYNYLEYKKESLIRHQGFYMEDGLDVIDMIYNPKSTLVIPRNVYHFELNPLINCITGILLDFKKHKITILDKYYIFDRIKKEMNGVLDFKKYYHFFH